MFIFMELSASGPQSLIWPSLAILATGLKSLAAFMLDFLLKLSQSEEASRDTFESLWSTCLIGGWPPLLRALHAVAISRFSISFSAPARRFLRPCCMGIQQPTLLRILRQATLNLDIQCSLARLSAFSASDTCPMTATTLRVWRDFLPLLTLRLPFLQQPEGRPTEIRKSVGCLTTVYD
ncbi:hypothetical protein BKA70DRAFT_292088 [Coprinopsis sp. MPI-PUGE-AT-0042]|nr:hypothetical protein BKA70DRAFT_292088 [Coprinopsis sp. MPI-PUGE-AT-0042]